MHAFVRQPVERVYPVPQIIQLRKRQVLSCAMDVLVHIRPQPVAVFGRAYTPMQAMRAPSCQNRP